MMKTQVLGFDIFLGEVRKCSRSEREKNKANKQTFRQQEELITKGVSSQRVGTANSGSGSDRLSGAE